jgi:hypothetical protein
MTIVGISVYDLNEMRLTPDRASYVPLTDTIRDLRASSADLSLSGRMLTQYAMSYIRVVFPAAGWSDKVLVGFRRHLANAVGLGSSLDEHEGVVVERDGILDAGDSTTKLCDWSSGRIARRLAALRAENHAVHKFVGGPKRRAFQRILLTARQHGPVIVVVLPVSKSYTQEFIDQGSLHEFERMLSEDMKASPETMLVRLDQVPGITDDGYFFDPVHLNVYGRRLTTPVFLEKISTGSRPK